MSIETLETTPAAALTDAELVMIVDGRWLVTGSTNWSLDAEAKQDNHLVVVDDATVAAEARAVLDLEHVKALTKAGR